MFELDECLSVSKKLKKIDEDITELKCRNSAPKNQIITDMPKGGGSLINNLDSYLIKLEKLEKRRKRVQFQLDMAWNVAEQALKDIGVTDPQAIQLMKYRFYNGLAWKKCSMKMQWTLNKCFYVYRSILDKNECRN